MREAGYACLIVAGNGTIGAYGAMQYLTGYFPTARGAFALLNLDAPPMLLVRSDVERRAVLAEQAATCPVLVTNASGSDYAAAAGAAARKARPGRIGVVGFQCMTAASGTALSTALGGSHAADATSILADVRSIKTLDDAAHLRAAAEIAEAGLSFALSSVRAGMMECELAGLVEGVVRGRGAQLVLVYVSRGEFTGRRPLARRIARDDLLSVFVELAGATGHWVELGAVIAMPKASDGQTRAVPCLESLRRGARALSAQATAGSVAAAMLDVLSAAQRVPSINLGHGVGIDEEPPWILEGSDAPIRCPAAIALHPSGTDATRADGCAVANTYLVHPDRVEPLSELPHALHVAT